MNNDLVTYYKERAAEYEKVYAKPERQKDIVTAARFLQKQLKAKTVFEVACGTGFWTERIVETARLVFATDINEAVMDIARQKANLKNRVTFAQANVYELQLDEQFEAAFGGFIWSHILLQDLEHFIERISQCVLPGGLLVFMDNNYVEGSNYPITETDAVGNTYQQRTLENGSYHLVLKNFPTRSFVEQKLNLLADKVHFIQLKYYWIAVCSIRNK